MKRMGLRWWVCWFVVGVLLPLTVRSEALNIDAIQSFNAKIEAAEKKLPQFKDDSAQLNVLQNEAMSIGLTVQSCIGEYERQQTQITQDIASLGTATDQEADELKNKRKQLNTQKQDVGNLLAQCRLVSLGAKTLENETRVALQRNLTAQLFARSNSIVTYMGNLILQPQRWTVEIEAIYETFKRLPMWDKSTLSAVLYGVVFGLAALLFSLYKRRLYRLQPPDFQLTTPTGNVIWLGLIKTLPYMAFSGVTWLVLMVNDASTSEVRLAFLLAALFTFSYTVVRALLRAVVPLVHVVAVSNNRAREIYFWAQLLFFTTLTGIVFHWGELTNITVDSLPSPINFEPNNLIGVVRVGLGVTIAFALMRLVWVLSKHIVVLKQLRMHVLDTIALLVAIGAFLFGYRNFGYFLLSSVFGTLFLFLFAWLCIRIPTEIFDGLDEGTAPWQQKIRQKLGLKSEERIPGLVWLRLTNLLMVLGTVVLLLMRLWGMSDQSIGLLLTKLNNGFTLGGLTFEPLRIIVGLLSFSVLLTLSQIIKQHLSDTWLHRTNLSYGARETVSTMSGYIGIIFAVLIGLSVAGIDFQNLAIIAGALSVGIGFGLQNIVNNFISGLILLFERPIRKGDLIRVGQAEGYVREISIRSTTIETSDCSDVIVPNSELISGQVINKTLSNRFGRIVIPINVAYGADTEQIMTVLRTIAEAHPAVINSNPDLKVGVFFLSFGESALNFQLRCFVRDNATMTGVQSDLNLAIDKAFREQGIEMPLPQRMVHLTQA